MSPAILAVVIPLLVGAFLAGGNARKAAAQVERIYPEPGVPWRVLDLAVDFVEKIAV